MLSPAPFFISQSWNLYRRNFTGLRPYMLLLFIPALIMSLSGAIGVVLSALLPFSEAAVTVVLALLSLASWIFSMLTSLALMIAQKHMVEAGTVTPWKDAYHQAWPFLLPVIWVSILVGLIVLAGLLLLLVPAVIFSFWYVFSVYETLFSGQRGYAALKASKALVSGRWAAIAWRVIAPGAVFALVMGLVTFLVTLPFGIMSPASYGLGIDLATGPSLSTVGLEIGHSLLSSLVTAVLSPLASLPLLLLYLEAKKTPVEMVPTPVIPS